MTPGRLSVPCEARTPPKPRVSSEDVGTQHDCRTDSTKIARYPDDVTKLVGLSKARVVILIRLSGAARTRRPADRLAPTHKTRRTRPTARVPDGRRGGSTGRRRRCSAG